MRVLLSVALAGILQFGAPVPSAAQSNISSLNFLAGRWIENGPDGFQEETWSPIQGANVFGTFRVLKSGHAVFFEFWSVEQQDGKTIMLLKHYNAA